MRRENPLASDGLESIKANSDIFLWSRSPAPVIPASPRLFSVEASCWSKPRREEDLTQVFQAFFGVAGSAADRFILGAVDMKDIGIPEPFRNACRVQQVELFRATTEDDNEVHYACMARSLLQAEQLSHFLLFPVSGMTYCHQLDRDASMADFIGLLRKAENPPEDRLLTATVLAMTGGVILSGLLVNYHASFSFISRSLGSRNSFYNRLVGESCEDGPPRSGPK